MYAIRSYYGRLSVSLLTLSLVATLACSGDESAPERVFLSIGTAPTGGAFFVVGGALADVSAVLAGNGSIVQWDELALRARAWRAQKATWLMLALARELAGAPVPQAALDGLYEPGYDARNNFV